MYLDDSYNDSRGNGISTDAPASGVFIIHPVFKQKSSAQNRTISSCLEEALGLANAIDLEVVENIPVNIPEIKPATLFGSGKVNELRGYIKNSDVSLVIVNSKLTPIQQRNLEKQWDCKVIDRTALILEIFGARARTHEGKLQVELAALNYQKSRLVRSWTHLERQRGGFGFMGGPGESQIEIDRRLISDEIAKLKKQLEQVKRTRNLHRKNRRSVPFPIVALLGYTNAGKSTLFNYLTGAKVMAQDKLFATLDPTMRALELPSGGKIIISDTVGFVSDLPTELVAAFSATLEDVLEADILLHVRDISHTDTVAQKEDVEQVIRKLFNSDSLPDNLIEVCNKIDNINFEGSDYGDIKNEGGRVYISAKTGEGVSNLVETIDKMVSRLFFQEVIYHLKMDYGKVLSWLYSNGKVIKKDIVDDEEILVKVQLSKDNIKRFEYRYGQIPV
ncbi:MAG: GTPase HflX [Rickettsiales bacterium]